MPSLRYFTIATEIEGGGGAGYARHAHVTVQQDGITTHLKELLQQYTLVEPCLKHLVPLSITRDLPSHEAQQDVMYCLTNTDCSK